MLYRNSFTRKLISISLILCVCWIVFGVQYKFLADQKAIQKEIKKRIKQGVPESELFEFDLNKISKDPGFSWVKSNEFILGNEMFDIVHRKGNLAFCINDKQEAQLFQYLDEMTRNAWNAKHDFKRFVSIQFFFTGNEFTSDPLSVIRYFKIPEKDYGLLPGFCLEKEYPPPFSGTC